MNSDGCVGTCSGNAYFEMISPVYSRYRPPPQQQTRREVALVSTEWSRHTHNRGPGRALDLMCGRGRHSVPLAEQRWQVVALDLDMEFLRHVQAESVRRGLGIGAVAGDVRRLPLGGSFDLVLSLGTSFGVGMASGAHCLKLLRNVFALVRDGGVVAIEVFDPSRRFAAGIKIRDHDVPGAGTLRKVATWDPVDEVEHVVGRIDWPHPITEACYIQFTPTDSTMTALLTAAGFRNVTQSDSSLGWTTDDARVYFAQRPGRTL